MNIKGLIDNAFAKMWIERMQSPKAIRMNPTDMVELVKDLFADQEQALDKIEPYWPGIAASRRVELRAAKAIKISHWVNSYSGGTPVEVIEDSTVTPGTLDLVGVAA